MDKINVGIIIFCICVFGVIDTIAPSGNARLEQYQCNGT